MYFDVFPDIVGWVLMVLGTFKLSLYTKKMRAASVFAAVLLPISLFTLLHGFGVFASLPNGGNDIYSILSYIYVTLLAAYHFFMLEGARDIALDTGTLPGLASQLRAATVISCVYYLLKIAYPFTSSVPSIQVVCFTMIQLMYVVVLIYNEYLMYTCFRRITVI